MSQFNNWMLTMVRAKPIQVTMVNAVPLACGGAFWATNVENKGESAMTTMPQKKRKIINGKMDVQLKIGDNKQQIPERERKILADLRAPIF